MKPVSYTHLDLYKKQPRGNLEITENNVRPFLNPLSIQKIPMVVEVTFQLLTRIGIRNIQTLSEMPPEILQQMIGKNGVELWRKANGIDNSPVAVSYTHLDVYKRQC